MPRFRSGAGAPFVGLAVAEGSAPPFLWESRPVDAEGRVRLPSVPPGDWQVHVAATGYVARRIAVRVPGPPVELELFESGQLRIRVPELFVSEARAELALVGSDARAFSSLGTDGVLRERWDVVGGHGPRRRTTRLARGCSRCVRPTAGPGPVASTSPPVLSPTSCWNRTPAPKRQRSRYFSGRLTRPSLSNVSFTVDTRLQPLRSRVAFFRSPS